MRCLSLCCIVKDEDASLKEWLVYHSLLGVEHFFVYDNGSAYPVRLRIEEFGLQDRVTVTDFPGAAVQVAAYNHCLEHFGESSKWIGFIDLDEFICLREEKDLRLLLAEYEEYAGVALSWRTFGSGGHLRKPGLPVIAAYTEALPAALPANLHIKSIVRPAAAQKAASPHHFLYAPGQWAVTPGRRPVPQDSPLSKPEYGPAWINHYFYKSQQDWEEKILRGRADVAGEKYKRRMDDFWEHAALPCEKEDTMLARLRELMQVINGRAMLPSVAVEKDGFDVLLHRAEESMAQGEYAAARLLLNSAALQGDSAVLWTLRAKAARLQGRLNSAELFIHRALRCPMHPDTCREEAELCAARRNMKEMKEHAVFMENLALFAAEALKAE